LRMANERDGLAARLKAAVGGGDTQDVEQEPVTGRPAAGPVTLEAGQILARHYKIVRKLGAGGMGQVYEVEDQTLDNRRFAIKVLPPELSCDPSAVERLKAEALAAMELHHTNIMTVNAFEGLETVKFLVMEYLDGPNLESALEDKGRFTVDEVVDVAQQVCPALDFAHSRNVIHRDIKPANLVYKVEAGRRVVKIADLGIAVQASTTDKVQAAGTLFYMAPELFGGARPTAWSDQYALAASFYELLCGTPPIVGKTIPEIIELSKTQIPSPIEGLPEHVNGAVLRGLAKEPRQRFATCVELLVALQGRAVVRTAADAEYEQRVAQKREAQIRQVLDSALFEDDGAAEDERWEREQEERAAREELKRRAAERAQQRQEPSVAPTYLPPEGPAAVPPAFATPTVVPPVAAVAPPPPESPTTPVAPTTAPMMPRTAGVPGRHVRQMAPQAFQVPTAPPAGVSVDFEQKRVEDLDKLVGDARKALRDTVLMTVGFVVVVVAVVYLLF